MSPDPRSRLDRGAGLALVQSLFRIGLCRGRLQGCYRLTVQGEVAADASSLAELIGRTHELFLSWEHPTTGFLTYFHAAAVSRGGHGVLLPGVSAIGKSTLAAYWATERQVNSGRSDQPAVAIATQSSPR